MGLGKTSKKVGSESVGFRTGLSEKS